MKKLLWIVGGILIALVIAIISVPLFVNVDQYRPQIQAEANKRINGKLELGKLNLSLWGAIKIHAESIKLSVNNFPGTLVDTQQFHLEIPFLSILSGQPAIVAVLQEPKISVIKDENGKMNAMELMKAATPAEIAAAQAAPVPPVAPDSAATKVPALLAGATLGLRIEKGNLHYVDKLAKADYQIQGLELDAQNLGLGTTMNVKLIAPLKGKTPSMTFEGPLEMNAEIAPILVGTNVKSARGTLNVDATKLAVDMPGTFHKSNAVPLTAKVQLEGNDQETLLRQVEVQFNQYRFHAKGRVTLNPMTAKVDFNADPMRLDQVKDFVPMVVPYDLKGIANLNANLDYTPQAIRLSGDLKVADGAFFMKDVLKVPLQFQVQAGFSENSLSLTRASLSGPDSELQFVGNVKNFLAPQFSLSVSGKSFNVDKTLVLPSSEPAKHAGLSLVSEAVAAPPPPPDVNPMAALAANPIVAKASGTMNAQVGKVIVYGTTLEQVMAKAQLQNMNLKIQDASLRTFGGTVRTVGDFDLRSPGLKFSATGNAAGVSGNDAFVTYFPKYKNTLEGTLGANWKVSGALYPAAARIHNLKGTAKLLASDGALKSVDIQSSINSAMQKIPFLKDKKPLEIDDGFKTMTADLSFDGGVIKADPIDVQPRNKGFIIKGKSVIQESLEQESLLDIYDPQGRLPKEIQAAAGKPVLALRLYGPLMAPKTDYEYTVKRLASNAGKNALKNVAGKALDKFIGSQPAGDAKGDALKNAAEKLKKQFKLFK